MMFDATAGNAKDAAEKAPRGESATLLIATDGLAQSDAAMMFARSLPADLRSSVLVLNVVDHAPIPWGNVDRGLILEYERDLYEEAKRRTNTQVARLGDPAWRISVRSGSPAETIASAAQECGARLVLVGLGEHGASARIFGNETALRVMRASRTPVLAIDAKTKSPLRRVLIAMDFREASIEAARLALEFVPPGATVTIAHVIPWERKEYVPEQWLRDYEAHVNEHLVRVVGWLDRTGDYTIERKILYGRPGAELLTHARHIEADLIVCGTHGRSTLSRMFMGETLAKLVRRANRSILVLPAAAAFTGFHSKHEVRSGGEKEPDWPARLKAFSERNSARRSTLEVENADIGSQVELSGYRFIGASYDPPSRRAQLMFGGEESGAPHLSRGISNVKSIEILSALGGNGDTALSIVNDDSQTLLLFDRKPTGG